MSLSPISIEPSLYQRTKLLEKRPGSGIPKNIEIKEEIGRGSNNRVFKAEHESGTIVVVRHPRRKSDTERAGYAAWECRHTLMASNLDVAPKVYDAWYVRHGKPKQKAGLHMITEFLPLDGQEIYTNYIEEVLSHEEEMEEALCKNIKALADIGMLCYDLKPGNIVVDFDSFRVRFIDFGREFCEYNTWDMNSEERTPITSYIKKISLEYEKDDKKACSLYHHLLFLTMLVLLSSNTAYYIYSIKEKVNIEKNLRADLNVLGPVTKKILSDTRGNVIGLLKNILRQEDVRSTCRHYMSRRNAGTRRLLQWAKGEKV